MSSQEIERKLDRVRSMIEATPATNKEYSVLISLEKELKSALTSVKASTVKLHVDEGPTCEGCQ